MEFWATGCDHHNKLLLPGGLCAECDAYARGKKDGIAAGLKTLDAELAAAHKQTREMEEQMEEQVESLQQSLNSWKNIAEQLRAQKVELLDRLKDASPVPIFKPPWETRISDPEADRVVNWLLGFSFVGLVTVVTSIICGIAAVLSHVSVTWV